jgi:hypothetical protein
MTSPPRIEVLDLGVNWDGGAPMPQLLIGSHTAVILCYEQLASLEDEDHVIKIKFDDCLSVRMGHPNDEVLHAHPYWDLGLQGYEAHLVHDSPLIREHRRINAHHEWHSDSEWDQLNHYFLVFHDEVVEAVAKGIGATRVPGDLATELAQVAAELVSHAGRQTGHR